MRQTHHKRPSPPSISLIVTVLNEANTIAALWTSITQQTLLPKEVIVADGGSTDLTRSILARLQANQPPFSVTILHTPGNRSIGRNAAITAAQYSLIACTDAGCILDQHWLEELSKKQQHTQADVVAGYYRGQATTPWQEAVVPYALVMPDRLPLPPEPFLPATRSLLCSKKTWEAAGKFNTSLADNEDYAFAHALVKTKQKLTFAPDALVYWQPPKHWFATARMFYRFAKGDIVAGLWRPKVGLIFARYLFFGGMLCGALYNHSQLWSWGLILSMGIYTWWAVQKNLRYCPRSWQLLPPMQYLADLSVMLGTAVGFKQLLSQRIKNTFFSQIQ